MVLKGPVFASTLKLQWASWHWLSGGINYSANATRVSEEIMSIKFCYLHIFRNIHNIVWKSVFFLFSISSFAMIPFLSIHFSWKTLVDEAALKDTAGRLTFYKTNLDFLQKNRTDFTENRSRILHSITLFHMSRDTINAQVSTQ